MRKKGPSAKPPLIQAEVRMVPVVTAASLHSMAMKVQEDASFLLLPQVLEALVEAAQKGAMGAVLRMDHVLRGLGGQWEVHAGAIGEALCRELRKLGLAAQLAKSDDDRGWERLVLEATWKEVAS